MPIKFYTDSIKLDIFVIFILFLAGLKFTFGLETSLDLGLQDETSYLYAGVKFAELGYPGAQWGPLYSLWYYCLSLLEPDRVNLFYLNSRLMIILPPLFIYIFLRKNRVTISTCMVIAWLLLVCRANANTIPKVSHFALLIILATLIIVHSTRTLFWNSSTGAIGALIAAYVRPEYFYAYLLFSLLFIAVLASNFRDLTKKQWIFSSGLILGSFVLLNFSGLPTNGDRSIVAFGQHFSWNWVTWTGSSLNPWTNWEMIMEKNFGNAHSSIGDAIRNNPQAFFKHLVYNLNPLVHLKHLPILALPAFIPVGKIPMENISLIRSLILPISIIVLVFITIFIITKHKIITGKIRNNFPANKSLFIIIGIFLFPGLASIVLIYPHNHYILTIGVLSLSSILFLLNNPSAEETTPNYKYVLSLGLLMMLTPQYANQDAGRDTHQSSKLSIIRFIQTLDITKPVNMLEADGGYNTYIGDNFNRIPESEKNSSFEHFRSEHHINMIILTGFLTQDSRYINDPEWLEFIENYQHYGYRQLSIPNTETRIIVANELLD